VSASQLYLHVNNEEEPSPATEFLKEQWSNFYKANSVTFGDVILADFLAVRQIEAGEV
jgi:hypothetical protein